MAVDLTNDSKTVVFGEDGIVIRQYISGIEGGRALDITSFSAVTGTSIVKSGALITRNATTGIYSVAPVKLDASGNVVYTDSTDENPFDASAVVGILVATIDAKKDGAAIMTAGKVNKAVLPYGGSAKVTTIKTTSVLTHIEFTEDGE